MAKKGTARKGASFGEVKLKRGIDEQRLKAKGGIRTDLPDNEEVTLQFLESMKKCAEYDEHIWQEDGDWNFVPCLISVGYEECPLCESENERKSGTSLTYLINVYNHNTKKVELLKGGKKIFEQIWNFYQKKPKMFMERTYEVTRFPTKPISYNVSKGDAELKSGDFKLLDADRFIQQALERYYEGDVPGAGDMDDDEEEKPRKKKKKKKR